MNFFKIFIIGFYVSCTVFNANATNFLAKKDSSTFVQMVHKIKPVSFDTNYIRNYPKAFSIALPITAPFLNFTLRDYRSGNKLEFVPNQHYDLGIGFQYKFIEFVLGTGINWSPKDNDIKGKTKYIDIQSRILLRRLATDFSFQQYAGFYVKNSSDFANYNSLAPFEVRPDIKASLISLNTNYVFNHKKFSYRNSFGFSETQLKSAGSLLMGGYFSSFHVRADSGFVSNVFSNYFEDDKIKNGSNQTYGFNIGYIYTLVFAKNYYFTLSAVQGIGLHNVRYKIPENRIARNNYDLATKTNLRFAWGYNTRKFFAGGMFIYDFYNFNNHYNTTFDFSTGKIRLFVGYRFESKKLNKLSDKIQDKIVK